MQLTAEQLDPIRPTRAFQAILGALDRSPVGVMILPEGRHVTNRNLAAERVMSLRDGLTVDRHGQLRAHRIDDDRRLRRAIELANEKVLLSLARPSGRDPLLVEVCPIAGGVYLLVIDPAESVRVSTRGMEVLYGLTPAESQVCQLMATGTGTSEIAASRGVSVETVRAQAKQILRKTGTSSRSQLVRLALTVNLPIDEA